MSIDHWSKIGILEREIALYKKLIKKGVEISFLTYGNSRDNKYKNKLGDIKILCNAYNLPIKLYEFLIPILHFKSFMNSQILKTNQMNGSYISLVISKIFQKPLICRIGYLFSQFQLKRKGKQSKSYINALKLESKIFQSSKINVVTTGLIKSQILENNKSIKKEKITVIPNYVDMDVFKPINSTDNRKKFDVLFIGRIAKQKNVNSLLIAVSKLKLKTHIVGDGNIKNNLQNEYQSKKIKWSENIPNTQLPKIYDSSKIFVLPSFYEGHPKTLIEAMSCGSAIIGANSPGIKNIINNEINGILCDTDPDSIMERISYLLKNPKKRISIGKKARDDAINRYSLDKIAKIEFDLYSKLKN